MLTGKKLSGSKAHSMLILLKKKHLYFAYIEKKHGGRARNTSNYQ